MSKKVLSGKVLHGWPAGDPLMAFKLDLLARFCRKSKEIEGWQFDHLTKQAAAGSLQQHFLLMLSENSCCQMSRTTIVVNIIGSNPKTSPLSRSNHDCLDNAVPRHQHVAPFQVPMANSAAVQVLKAQQQLARVVAHQLLTEFAKPKGHALWKGQFDYSQQQDKINDVDWAGLLAR
eukprot:1158136-Pelagomonas_calceolata.AAC.2